MLSWWRWRRWWTHTLTVGYTMRDIRYKWNEGPKSVGVSSEVSLPQFKVLGHRMRAMEISLTTGTCRRLPIFIRNVIVTVILLLTLLENISYCFRSVPFSHCSVLYCTYTSTCFDHRSCSYRSNCFHVSSCLIFWFTDPMN